MVIIKFLFLIFAILFAMLSINLIEDFVDLLSTGKADFSDFIQFIIVGILFLFITILFINSFAVEMRREKLQKRLPIRTDYAKVISKHIKVTGRHAVTRFYVAFSLDSGEKKQFEVTNEQYSFLIEEEIGKLYYKEGNGFAFFENFEVNERNTNY